MHGLDCEMWRGDVVAVIAWYINCTYSLSLKQTTTITKWMTTNARTVQYQGQWARSYQTNNMYYHIFCCNMLIFACPIIANSQCWLFALVLSGQIREKYPYLPSNIRICPHISVFSPYSTSGICAVVSKYRERWCIKICIKSYFNQINTFQHIGINFK